MNSFKIAVSRYELHSKIPARDPIWPKFNASFENEELDTHAVMDTIYCGQAITTHHKNHWRTVENYLCGQHIGLDFDTEDERSTMKQLLQDKFIRKHAAFLHTTISHKPEAPRARVIFLLDRPIQQAPNYAMAATSLLWLFGSADRQCKDAVRFFYGAPNCDMEYLGNVLPLELVIKSIKQYQASGAIEKRKATRRKYSAPATQKEVANALGFIPPWGIDYDEWVTVLMGIHSEFGEEGYPLAEYWAQGIEGEVEQKWRSFRGDGNPIGQVTIASVFGLAKKFGWHKLAVDSDEAV
jgi:hypothetical protein